MPVGTFHSPVSVCLKTWAVMLHVNCQQPASTTPGFRGHAELAAHQVEDEEVLP